MSIADSSASSCVVYLANALPSANTEFGALTLDRLDRPAASRSRASRRLSSIVHALGELLVDQLLQRDRIEELDHLLRSGWPTARASCSGRASSPMAVFLAAALGGVDRLVDRDDDVGDRDLVGLRPSV